MEFVNIHGQPIEIKPEKRKREKAASRTEPKCMGWTVKGFSPEQLAAAKADHDAKYARGEVTAQWSEESYMNGAKPKALRRAPYSTPAIADEALALAERYRWKRLLREEVRKD